MRPGAKLGLAIFDFENHYQLFPATQFSNRQNMTREKQYTALYFPRHL
jgi:hypothetical protein